MLDSLVTQQLGLHLFGTPGFNGDYLIDPDNRIAVVGHCECPFNPRGDGRRFPYVIRNLPRWQPNEGGACVQVNLPVDGLVHGNWKLLCNSITVSVLFESHCRYWLSRPRCIHRLQNPTAGRYA